MAQTKVNPTRMELSRLKKRLATAVRGHKLMKDKRDEMVRQFVILARKNMERRKQVESQRSGALDDFLLARAVMSEDSLESALLYPAKEVTLRLGRQNIMSVDAVSYTHLEGLLAQIGDYAQVERLPEYEKSVPLFIAAHRSQEEDLRDALRSAGFTDAGLSLSGLVKEEIARLRQDVYKRQPFGSGDGRYQGSGVRDRREGRIQQAEIRERGASGPAGT